MLRIDVSPLVRDPDTGEMQPKARMPWLKASLRTSKHVKRNPTVSFNIN